MNENEIAVNNKTEVVNKTKEVFDNKASDIFVLNNRVVKVQAFIDNIEEKKEI